MQFNKNNKTSHLVKNHKKLKKNRKKYNKFNR